MIVLHSLSVLQDALDVPAFSGSEEARIAEGLIDSYRTGDPEAVRQFVASHPTFLELDNQVGLKTVLTLADPVSATSLDPGLLL